MAPSLLFDVAGKDLTQAAYDADFIESVNPHRGHMRQVDRLAWVSEDFTQILGVKDIGDDEFWVAGHIPGRPIFPGVLMLEGAAQLASICFQIRNQAATGEEIGTRFLGFAKIDDVKFRGQVKPGDTLALLCQEIQCKPRRSICQAQGLVNGDLVFEAKITGMPL